MLDVFNLFKKQGRSVTAAPFRLTLEQKRHKVQELIDTLAKFETDRKQKGRLLMIDIEGLPEERIDYLLKKTIEILGTTAQKEFPQK